MNIRLRATQYIWIAYTVTMIGLFLGTAINEAPILAGHVVIAVAASIMAFLSTGTVWNWGNVSANEVMIEEDEEAAKKRKNNAKLEQIVSRLSDDERAVLREKLADDRGHYGLSDDGELVDYAVRK